MSKQPKCLHFSVERFDIGPITERWFKCIFCGRETPFIPEPAHEKKPA